MLISTKSVQAELDKLQGQVKDFNSQDREFRKKFASKFYNEYLLKLNTIAMDAFALGGPQLSPSVYVHLIGIVAQFGYVDADGKKCK